MWANVLKEYKDKPNVSVLEVGSYQGRSAIWLLENILTDPTSRITCIDTFAGSVEHTSEQKDSIEELFDFNTRVFKHKIMKLKGNSADVLRSLSKQQYDMIYIDGDHRAPYVLMDLILAFPLLKIGGLLICDDYASGINLDCPKSSIDAFVNVFMEKVKPCFIGWQFVLQKIAD